MKKKILVIVLTHPEKNSFSRKNYEVLANTAKKQNLEVITFDVYDFPMIKKNPIKNGFPKEFDKPCKAIIAADFIAFIGPMWNFGFPGGFKNFIDGVTQSKKFFQFKSSNFAKLLLKFPVFKYIIPKAKPIGLLKGKKVLTIWTSDAPTWYYRLFWWKNHLHNYIKTIFKYCGIRKFDDLTLGMTRNRSKTEIKKWLTKIENYQFK